MQIGSIVRIDLHGRRVRGWVVAEGAGTDKVVDLKPIAKVSPGFVAPDLIDLSTWAAWRWAGKRRTFLSTASEFRSAPRSLSSDRPSPVATTKIVLRLAPAIDPWDSVIAAAQGPTLLLVPSVSRVARWQVRLRQAGVQNIVVGARAGAWAPVPGLASVVVIDAHDEAYVEERAPTWNAWVVAAERARRANAPCLLISPVPTLEHLAWGELAQTDRATERRGWPRTEVIDRRGDDPRKGLWSDRAVELARGSGRVVCVLNRTGRAKLLACAKCATVATCERCAGVVTLPGEDLVCRRCGTTRPQVCLQCGGSKLKQLRIGTTRAAEELCALIGEPVGEVTGASDAVGFERVLVGTEALLHRVAKADAVVFVDLDAELAAPHFRANEAALALLARASRIVRGRTENGVVVVQTRQPEHRVLRAVTTIDPESVAASDREMRQALGLPPFSALAHVSGDDASMRIEALRGQIGITVRGPDERGGYLVLGSDHEVLCDALAISTGGRVSVDPVRI